MQLGIESRAVVKVCAGAALGVAVMATLKRKKKGQGSRRTARVMDWVSFTSVHFCVCARQLSAFYTEPLHPRSRGLRQTVSDLMLSTLKPR